MCLCVQTPSAQLGCSTANAPSPALRHAIVSTSRRFARKSVWMAVHALVTYHSRYLPVFPSLCCSVTSSGNMVCICFSVGKVLDGNRCVEVSQCSCVHMGRHFPPGSTISQDCNTWWESNMHAGQCINTQIERNTTPPHSIAFFPAACAVMAPGNAPMKAALVREMYSSGQCTDLHILLIWKVLRC